MAPQPIYDAYCHITEGLTYKPLTIYLSPQGRVFKQEIVRELSEYNHIVLLCGHYEGIDQRVLDEIVDAEISLGDFVLTGGEIPAMAVRVIQRTDKRGIVLVSKAYEVENFKRRGSTSIYRKK